MKSFFILVCLFVPFVFSHAAMAFTEVKSVTANDVANYYPPVIDGVPTANQLNGSLPNLSAIGPNNKSFLNFLTQTSNNPYYTVDGTQNGAKIPVLSGDKLGFVGSSKVFTFAWPKTGNTVYLYKQSIGSRGPENLANGTQLYYYPSPVWGNNYTTLTSCINLVNNNDQKIPINYFYESGERQGKPRISHAVLFDGIGNNKPLLFVLHKAEGWYYIYQFPNYSPIDKVNNCQTLAPINQGFLKNDVGTNIPGEVLDALLPVDYDNSGRESLHGLQSGNAKWSYLWGFNANGSFIPQFISSDFPGLNPLKINMSEVYTVFTNKISSAFSNLVGASEAYLTQRNGYTRIFKEKGLFKSEFKQNCLDKPDLCENKLLLISIDQAWSNGAIAQNAIASQKVLIDNISQMQILLRKVPTPNKAGVRLAVLINPAHKNKASLEAMLQTLQANNIRFVFDILSSDTIALSKSASNVAVPDSAYPALGLNLSEGQIDANALSYYEKKYGSLFLGYRIFEQQGLQFHFDSLLAVYPSDAVHTYRYSTNADKSCTPSAGQNPLPPTNAYFDDSLKRYVQNIMARAHSSNRRVYWSDNAGFNGYEYYHGGARGTQMWNAYNDYRAFKACMIKTFGSTVVPIYANNEALSVTAPNGKLQVAPNNFRLNAWQNDPKYYLSAAGNPDGDYGISNQSWALDQSFYFNDVTAPPEQLYVWTVNALNQRNANTIQIEPLWYFFATPKGSTRDDFKPTYSSTCPQGSVLPTMIPQLRALGVSDVSTLIKCH